jgi:hypothetical protein
MRTVFTAREKQPITYTRVIVVDTREIKDAIEDDDVQAFLKFHTTLGRGENFIHIVNDSFYKIETERHTIGRGDTLCAKRNYTCSVGPSNTVTCPGCLAIGKGLAVRDLTDQQVLSMLDNRAVSINRKKPTSK